MEDLISRQTEADARKKCMTCMHDPPKRDKWPCVDCDMREPADRWEAQDVHR